MEGLARAFDLKRNSLTHRTVAIIGAGANRDIPAAIRAWGPPAHHRLGLRCRSIGCAYNFVMSRQTPLLLALALSLGAAHANNHIVDLRWSSDGRFVHQAQIKPQAFVEVCGELPAPASVAWTFTASQPLDFNVHYHVGKEVVYPVKPSPLQSGGGTLNVTVPQHYCWMWANKGTEAVTLNTELRR